ncbi:MAG: DUF1624 domain-containing protein [Clostridia bacterium]|nr:DUF1624 domain-containing protein [Clostridia bacterium]
MAKSRIHLLDELRGLCVLLMVVYHGLYTIGYLFDSEVALWFFRFFTPVEPLFAGIFIVLCGFSCRLSKNNWKRGALLAVIAVGMSAVLWVVMPDQMIWFGVLHCLAVCILVFAALRPLLDRVPTIVGLLVMIALAVLTFHVPFDSDGYFGFAPFTYDVPADWKTMWWGVPLGFTPTDSADIFPLFPWLFWFLAGSFLGKWHDKLPAFTKKRHIPPLAFLGRHSLIIYLVHQPVIYGISYAVEWLTARV